MKYILVSLILMLASPVASACSYSFPGHIGALQRLDALFEGKVAAVYLDGRQIDIATLAAELQASDGEIEVRLKVLPTQHYLGPEDALVDVYTWHQNSSSCITALSFNPDGDTWGLAKHKGKWITSRFHKRIAADAKETLEATAAYYADLNAATGAQASAADFIAQEKQRLIDLASQDPAINPHSFKTDPVLLARLPKQVLEARLAFAETLGLTDEAEATQNALMQ